MEIGELIGVARSALQAEDPSWPKALESALKDPRQNLVGWRVRDPFLQWVNADAERSGAALRLLWVISSSRRYASSSNCCQRSRR